MPKPLSGEDKEEFMKRCVPKVLEDGAAEDGKQAYAICLSLWGSKEFLDMVEWGKYSQTVD